MNPSVYSSHADQIATIVSTHWAPHFRIIGSERFRVLLRERAANKPKAELVKLPKGGANLDWSQSAKILIDAIELAASLIALYEFVRSDTLTREHLVAELDRRGLTPKDLEKPVLDKRLEVAEDVIESKNVDKTS